ncbi:uncharacterized protein TA08930 [Theileria annulata]|uniref:RING-type domain-containing protein n=1 Tax=Theileria annulata TaxID=5874 RepID=Q4U9D8_THEAN|nr:uncharacterized protein TA08930 [Theileria annulata]CAI76565.1 hypothetical protein, conserved [Theileria annulata]|eukprot:XP_953190.1 hypothetical protein, conserved [Theileria annulata]
MLSTSDSGSDSNYSSINRYTFDTCQNTRDRYNFPSNKDNSKFGADSNGISAESSECHSVSADDSDCQDLNSENETESECESETESESEQDQIPQSTDHLTTSFDIPEFDRDILEGESYSQNLFGDPDQQFDNDNSPVSSFGVGSQNRDDCEIVNIVMSNPPRDLIDLSNVEEVNTSSEVEPSHSTPILVDDSNNVEASSSFNSNVPEVVDDVSVDPNSSPNSRKRKRESDDCIMGPIRWVNKSQAQFPLDYMSNRHISNAYKFFDTDSSWDSKIIEDLEFLFKCPICYSTITRFRSGKAPNENDKVIYSTKCGHLFCFECIESVKSRRECSICRKALRDRNQCHVVFP